MFDRTVTKHRGFTLVELVITLIIVGILAVFVAPRFTAGGFSARGFHDEVLATIRYAQKAAVAQRQAVFVTADASSRICLSTAPIPDCSSPSGLMNPATGGPYSRTAPDGVTLSVASFAFSGLGSPEPNNAVTINVVGDGQTRTITIERETGYVH